MVWRSLEPFNNHKHNRKFHKKSCYVKICIFCIWILYFISCIVLPLWRNNVHKKLWLCIDSFKMPILEICITTCGCCTGCVLILLNVVNVISAFSKCYPVNGQNYCFYTNGSVLSWDKAREFCENRNSTLPIITDEHINNVFQRFILDRYKGGSDTDLDNVWLNAHASNDSESRKWHWMNGQHSG